MEDRFAEGDEAMAELLKQKRKLLSTEGLRPTDSEYTRRSNEAELLRLKEEDHALSAQSHRLEAHRFRRIRDSALKFW